MPLRDVPHPGFSGGLNLRSQPDAVRPDQAVDALNVTFSSAGAVKQRAGYGLFTAAQGTNRYDSLTEFYRTTAAPQIVAGAGNRLEGLSTGGAVVASVATTASPHFFARFGSPTNELVFCANGIDTVRQWNGTAFSTPGYTGTTPTGMFVAVQSRDNRLVCARLATNVSRVLFSKEGDPLTFDANDYEDLTPGDGEAIQGVVSWGDATFVFKSTKFFVFYRTDTDPDGKPIFQYRTVDNGVGLAASRAVVAARDGVYFLDRTGVYKTTGGPPVPVSGDVDPFFTGDVGSFFQSLPLSAADISKAAMVAHDERIYLAVPTGSSTFNDRTLVFEPRYGWWTLYDLPAAAMATFRPGSANELIFAYGTGLKHLGRHHEAYVDDAGAVITSRWHSGWFDLGAPGNVKTVRAWKLWGLGRVTAGLAEDYETLTAAEVVAFSAGDTWGDGSGSDTWGDGSGSDVWASGASLSERQVRTAARGTKFSMQLDSTSGPWEVHSADLMVREARAPEATNN